jgi:hypothetical protein
LLPHYLAAPTLVSIGGVYRLADRLRLGDFALLMQAGSDALGRDPDAEEVLKFSDPEFGGWLEGDGLPLVLWCSLRRHWPDLAVDDAFDLATRITEAESLVLRWAAYRCAGRKPDTQGEGVDLALLKWGRVIRRFVDEGKGFPPQVAEYTVDQATLLLSDDDPEAKQEAIDQTRRFAEWEAEHLRIHGGNGAAPAVPAEVTLASLGYAIVPGQEATHGENKGDGDDEHEHNGRWGNGGGATADE